MKVFAVTFLCLLLFATIGGAAVAADSTVTLRVGVYENKPSYFTGDDGKQAGFWIDIIEAIAAREGWNIQYVTGTRDECLQRLKNNEIDLMPDYAYAEDRAKIYTFSSEPVYYGWSKVFSREGLVISAPSDLEGKTVAVLKDAINYDGPDSIQELTRSFNINCTFIKTDSYLSVFELLDRGAADAGVVTKDFANVYAGDYNVMPSDIIFQPVRRFFVFPHDANPALVTAIDNAIRDLKADGNSIYYTSSSRWLGAKPVEKPVISRETIFVLHSFIAVILLLMGGILLFRYQIKRKTRKLAEEIAERKQAEKVLKNSEEKYRNTLDNMMEGCQIIDSQYYYIYLNHTAVVHSHRSREELLGHTMMEAYPGIENTEIFRQIERSMKDKVSVRMENLFVYPDGSEAWYDLSIEPAPEGVILLSVDKTARKNALEAIVEAKNKLEAVFESMTDAVLITDAQGASVEFNNAFASYHRCLNKDECYAKVNRYAEYITLLYPDGSEVPPEMQPVNRALRGETGNGMEYQIYRKDTGEVWWGSYSFNPIKDKEGRIAGSVVVAHDITNRKRADETLKEIEISKSSLLEKLNQAQSVGMIGSWEWNLKTNYVWWSDETYNIFGVTHDYVPSFEANGKFIHPDDLKLYANSFERSLKTGEPLDIDLRLTAGNGQTKYGNAKGKVIFDSSGQPLRFIGTFMDITGRKQVDEALKESEDKFSRAFSSSPVGMAILDSITQVFVEVNERWAEILEYQPDEMLNRTTADLKLYPDTEIRTALWKTLYETKHVRNQEVVYRTKTGKHIQALLSAEIVMLKGREYLVSTLMDVTERRETEKALRENEAKLQEAQEMAHLGFWSWDVKTGAVEWSDEVFRIFHLDAEHFSPRIDSILDLSPWPEDHQRGQELINRAVESHLPGSFEQKFLRPDKTIGYYYSTFQGKYDEKNTLVAIVGTVLDITERKLADQALKESEEELRHIFEAVPEGITLADLNGVLLNTNQAVVDMLQYENKWELIGRASDELIAEKDRENFSKYRQQIFKHGVVRDGLFTMLKKDGSEFSVEISAALLKGAQNKPLGVIAVTTDITARLKAQEEHRKIIEYQELDKVKTNLLSLISHELRTPLASIKGYASLLLMYNRKLTKEQKNESLEAIDRSTDRLAELIDHLLDMSRLDAGLLKLTLLPVQPKGLIGVAVDEAKLRSPNFDFKNESGTRLPEIMADGKRLRQILDNLLENAVKYSPPNTVITIKTEVKPEGLQISVTDQGRGIPEDEYKNIFERMYRIEQRMQKDPGGLGLGLSLCKALVEGHGGRIWVESIVGKGSTFYFTIPLKHEVKVTKNAEKKKTRV